jgi:pimeloyl-ACP methyl ester carboxylesterase
VTQTDTGIAVDREGPRGEPPVVLVHAGVADRRMWQPVWPDLIQRHDCVRLDLRGFGESVDAPSGSLDHVADLLGVLDHLEIDRCHLVGASLGSGVVVEAALTAPARVASLLLCPPGGALLAEMTPDLRAFVEEENAAMAAGDLDRAVRANVDTWLVGPGRDTGDVDPATVELVRTMQRRAFEVPATWGEVDEAELDPPALDRLADLTAPVLVLLGGHDLLTTHDAARRVVEGAPDVRRVDWPDAAHLPSLERPADFVALLEDWLED